MARRIMLLIAPVAMAGLIGGCASRADLLKLSKRVDAIQAEQQTQSAQMAKLGDSLSAVESGADRKVAAVNERIAALEGSLSKLQEDLATASQEIAGVAEEHQKLDARIGDVLKSLTEAQKMLISTLRNTRDIYGAQFRALNEVLETMETPETGAPPEN